MVHEKAMSISTQDTNFLRICEVRNKQLLSLNYS